MLVVVTEMRLSAVPTLLLFVGESLDEALAAAEEVVLIEMVASIIVVFICCAPFIKREPVMGTDTERVKKRSQS